MERADKLIKQMMIAKTVANPKAAVELTIKLTKENLKLKKEITRLKRLVNENK